MCEDGRRAQLIGGHQALPVPVEAAQGGLADDVAGNHAPLVHILRVQLEGSRPWMHEKQRVRARQQAIEARRKGFAEEREAIDSGISVSYDDELLRQEGTRIAYLLCRDQVEEAMMIEEEIITISVNHSLYGTDLEAMRIAA